MDRATAVVLCATFDQPAPYSRAASHAHRRRRHGDASSEWLFDEELRWPTGLEDRLGCLRHRRTNDGGDIAAGRTLLSQRRFAEDVLRASQMAFYLTPMNTHPVKPGARLTKDQSDLSPDPAFHRRYRGIVGNDPSFSS